VVMFLWKLIEIILNNVKEEVEMVAF
jgi:hypothetical protein